MHFATASLRTHDRAVASGRRRGPSRLSCSRSRSLKQGRGQRRAPGGGTRSRSTPTSPRRTTAISVTRAGGGDAEPELAGSGGGDRRLAVTGALRRRTAAHEADALGSHIELRPEQEAERDATRAVAGLRPWRAARS